VNRNNTPQWSAFPLKAGKVTYLLIFM